MELFLLCSDDAESDVRMVADECLNKVIKVGSPGQHRHDTELCSRRLRNLLTRVTHYIHHIHLQKEPWGRHSPSWASPAAFGAAQSLSCRTGCTTGWGARLAACRTVCPHCRGWAGRVLMVTPGCAFGGASRETTRPLDSSVVSLAPSFAPLSALWGSGRGSPACRSGCDVAAGWLGRGVAGQEVSQKRKPWLTGRSGERRGTCPPPRLPPDVEFVAKATELEPAVAFSVSCCHGPAPFFLIPDVLETVLCLLRLPPRRVPNPPGWLSFSHLECASVQSETLSPCGLTGARKGPDVVLHTFQSHSSRWLSRCLRSFSAGSWSRACGKRGHTALFITVGKCSGDPMSLAMYSALKPRPVPCGAAWTECRP